jgi:hypothetical protein
MKMVKRLRMKLFSYSQECGLLEVLLVEVKMMNVIKRNSAVCGELSQKLLNSLKEVSFLIITMMFLSKVGNIGKDKSINMNPLL